MMGHDSNRLQMIFAVLFHCIIEFVYSLPIYRFLEVITFTVKRYICSGLVCIEGPGYLNIPKRY